MAVAPLIVGLLLLAALVHASWNASSKSDQSRMATFATWQRGVIGGGIANTDYGALTDMLLLDEPFGSRWIAAATVIVEALVLMNGPQLL